MQKKILVVAYLIFSFTCTGVQAQLPNPQWGPFGLIVNDTIGNSSQINPRMVKSNNDTCLIIFEDFRSGTSDIYAQKIDTQGNLLLDPRGIPVCMGEGEQSNPRAVTDLSGGAIVVWQDNRRGDFDIYMQRIDADGKSLWAQDGVPVCEAPEGQFFPEIISDGMGGAIITWYDYRSGSEDIYAQRVDAQGRTLWKTQGVPVCQAEGTQWFPKIVPDGASGAIIAWMDRRSGNFDVYAQKVDYQGIAIWQQNGVPACQTDGNQENIDLVEDGASGAIIVWKDSRSVNPGIYVQKVGKDGKQILNSNGILVSQDTALSSPPKVAAAKNGGALIVWSDPHAGDPDVYMQFLSRDGKLLWGDYGSPIARTTGAQENPLIYGSSPYLVTWSDKRGGNYQLYAQKISETGIFSFNNEGVQISGNGIGPQNPDVAFSSAGDIICCYQDKKKGNFDIYAADISNSGKVNWIGVVNNTPGSVVHENLDTAYTDGGVVFAFEDYRSGYSNIYLQKVSSAGRLLWGKDGVAATTGKYDQKNPKLISDRNGGAVVVWEDYRVSAGPRIFSQKISSDGTLAWTDSGVPIAPQAPSLEQTKPRIIEDGAGGAILVYCDYRGNLSYQDIYAQRIGPGGEIMWGGQGKVVSAGDGNQDDPVIAPKSLFIAWTDYRNGERNSDIYAQKLDLSGHALLAEDGLAVCEAPDSQRDPFILDDREGGAIIAWTDRGGGSFDIFAQRLDNEGRPIFIKDGIPICQAARTQQGPILVSLAPKEEVFFWEDFRFGNWDIFAQKINNQGQTLFPEEGISVINVAGTQYSPSAAAFQGVAVVAWEDYRSGKYYNVFMQKVSADGKLLWGDDGFFVVGTSLGARHPKLVSLPDNSLVLGWEDYRYGRRGIYAQKFTF